MSEEDSQMLKDLGLDTSWDNHGSGDKEEIGCGCRNGNCEVETADTPV